MLLKNTASSLHFITPIWLCSQRGLPCHVELLPMRCALTAPFHPYRFINGGIFSVALSLKLPWPSVTRRCVFVEPGLSSLTLPVTAFAHLSDFLILAKHSLHFNRLL
ncbi:hypothetical protein K737_300498 [Holospora undulata HU1]|uniref:Uncharacterized protein n=1 Tax=Holospora undulata HU1 TaxID=1321371 RepID=A0A061JGD1_9PROT|nr:hypothetical protein K737_300498 [Holospora undulata HU1]